VNVIGRKTLLPIHVQESLNKTEELTKDNSTSILNVCIPYTSRDEMTRAVETTVQRVIDGELLLEDLSVKEVEAALDTSKCNLPPVDILVRTSGVRRLSDFLLYQVSEKTRLQFVSTYWPDFGLSDMIPIILDYQREQWTC